VHHKRDPFVLCPVPCECKARLAKRGMKVSVTHTVSVMQTTAATRQKCLTTRYLCKMHHVHRWQDYECLKAQKRASFFVRCHKFVYK
jgi:hypothetical protein